MASFLEAVQDATNISVIDRLLDLIIIRNSDGFGIVNEIINPKIEDQSKSEDGLKVGYWK